jgi:hypothetical protein
MLRNFKLLLALPLVLTACVASEEGVRKDAAETTAQVRKGPEAPPLKTITGFTPALRCMDNLFMMYGVRDIVMISEDLQDATKKVSAGAKDMMISSISQMTTRSRAVKLIAYGKDSGNVIGIIKELEKKVTVMPQYGIRGSISQLDENVAKKVEGGGLSIEPFLGIGKAATASTTILGIDLGVLLVEDLSILNGVTSINSVAIFRSGSGVEAEAGYSKFGINYQQNLSRSDGTSQALRTLIELAAIELMGKLTRVPYWVCLNGNTNDDSVKDQIADWYTGMFAEQGAFVGYWQQQMRVRGLYTGEVNGQPDEALTAAIMAYRQALGMEKNAKLDLDFFTAYLNANHYEVTPKAKDFLAKTAATPPAALAAASDNTPVKVSIVSLKGNTQFKKGEEIGLNIKPARDAYVYCYMQDENKVIQRFFPNRFNKDALVSTKGVQVPGAMKFKINANTKGVQEHIACFAANRDVFADLPPTVGAGDFEDLPVKTINEVKSAFEKAAGPSLGSANFAVNVR